MPINCCANVTFRHNFYRRYAGNNFLSGNIPVSLWSLAKLTKVRFDQNELTGAIPPPTAGLLLTSLRLDQNMLTGAIPSEIGRLTALTELRLSGNQLTGAIPSSIGQLVGLQSL